MDILSDNLDISTSTPQVLIFTETWLSPDISDSELCLTNYRIYRSDRHNRRGGGVLLAVKNTINSSFVCKYTYKASEHLAVKLDQLNLIIFVSYISPHTSPLLHNNDFFYIYCNFSKFVIETLDSLNQPNLRTVLVGDYNLSGICWLTTDRNLLFQTPVKPNINKLIKNSASTLCHLCSFLNLHQFFNNHSNKRYTLDLIFLPDSHLKINFMPFSNLLPEDAMHHECKFFIIENYIVKENSEKFEYYDFKSANYDELNHFLRSTDWSRIYCTDFNSSIQEFYKIIFEAIHKFVPRKVPQT